MKQKLIAFEVQENCTLDYTNFEYGETIEIPVDDCPHDWKGIEWFETYPQIFKPVYATPVNDKQEQTETVEGWSLLDMRPTSPVIYIEDGDYTICEIQTVGNRDNESHARLIASAPQLYRDNAQLKEQVKLLREALQVYKDIEKEHHGMMPVMLRPATKAIEQALNQSK